MSASNQVCQSVCCEEMGRSLVLGMWGGDGGSESLRVGPRTPKICEVGKMNLEGYIKRNPGSL